MRRINSDGKNSAENRGGVLKITAVAAPIAASTVVDRRLVRELRNAFYLIQSDRNTFEKTMRTIMITGRINQLAGRIPVNSLKTLLFFFLLAQFTPTAVCGSDTTGSGFQKEHQEVPEVFRQEQTGGCTDNNPFPEHKVGEVVKQPVEIHRNTLDKNSFWFGVFCGFVAVSAIINILPEKK